jgi:hypothetical protein
MYVPEHEYTQTVLIRARRINKIKQYVFHVRCGKLK